MASIPATVGMHVFAAVITSSPAPTPSARSASSIASVPDATPTASRAPQNAANDALERLDVRAADEAIAVEHLRERGVELRAQAVVLAAEIDERDRHPSPQYRSPCSR